MKTVLNRRSFFGLLLVACSKLYLTQTLANGKPFRDRFQAYRQTFRIEPDKEEAERIVKNIVNNRKLVPDLVKLEVPDIAEDGNVVPVTFSVKCSMKKNDFPRRVHVLGMENPFPEIAIYEFFQGAGKAEVSFRCRLRKSSVLMVIADMNDGRVGLEKKYVDVMLGACS